MGKSRKGFVTNSSSSSFIFATKEKLPERYAGWFESISKKDGISGLFRLLEAFCYYDYDYDMLEDIYNKLGFTIEQFLYMILFKNNMHNLYDDIIKAWNNSTEIYTVSLDNNCVYGYRDAELREFIFRQDIIYREDN